MNSHRVPRPTSPRVRRTTSRRVVDVHELLAALVAVRTHLGAAR